MRASLLGTVDFFHFMPRSLTMTLAGDHKFSAEENVLLHFLVHVLTDQDEVIHGVQAVQVEHHDTIFG